MLTKLTVKAPAKINLTLDVIGRRPNGYHDLRMLMQTIDVYDEITIQATGGPDITLTMNKELPDKIPAEKNLVYKAAQLMKTKFSLPPGFSIHLEKKIPAAAGLAGGSADCAATLLGINALCDLGLSKAELSEIGVTLGADVPFCIHQGTMLSEGIGEELTRLENLPPLWALLIKPDISVSTAYVYTHLNWETLPFHPNTELAIDAIRRHDMITLSQELSNVLETVTIPEYPIIQELKEFFLKNGVIGSLMSGSGPTTYGLFQDEILATLAYRTAKEKYPDCEVLLCQTKVPD